MDRRKFMGLGGIALSSMALGLPGQLPVVDKPGAPIRIGVIGTGGRGNWLMSIINELPGMEIVACCDTLPFRLKEGIELTGNRAKANTDYRSLLDDKNVDAVIIATPLSEHFQMAMDALDAGKHVYCEKTMTHSIDQALQLSGKVKSSRQVFQVGYQHRYNPLYHNIHETIRGGYLGTITHAEAHWNRNGNWRRSVPEPKYERQINWRMYREYSGGLMAELCSHQIDILDFILDGHPLKVSGFGGIDYWKDGRETYDNVYSIFEYPDGIKASFHSITTNSYESFGIKIYGTKATVVIKGEANHQGYIYPEPQAIEELKAEVDAVSSATMLILERGEPIPIKVENFPEGDIGPTSAALRHFGSCIVHGESPVANIDFGRKGAISVAMANTAMRNGTIETWKEDYS
jgi:predicted dehydrogenase